MKGNKMYCSSCDQHRAESMFWSVDHNRYVARCSMCRLDRPDNPGALDRTPPAPPKPDPPPRPREPSNIYLCKTPGLAACIKYVVDQLQPRDGRV